MRVKLLFSESLRSLGANLSTTIAATMTVLIGMFLLGLFIALGSWVVSWSDHVRRELLVKVFYEQDASATRADQRGPGPVRPDRRPAREVDHLRLGRQGARADARSSSPS